MPFKEQQIVRTKSAFINKTSFCFLAFTFFLSACSPPQNTEPDTSKDLVRERLLLDKGWRFFKYAEESEADNLIYDVRPEVHENIDGRPADAEPTAAVEINDDTSTEALKPWILPTANPFIADPKNHFSRPDGNPGEPLNLCSPTLMTASGSR